MAIGVGAGRSLGAGTGRARGDTRYSFAPQFLLASAIFVRRAQQIESRHVDDPDSDTETEHRGFVTAAIMQSVAAVEAECAELLMHGPGSHLGSAGTDASARDFLAPLASFIDAQEILCRYKLILHLLHKPPPDSGGRAWRDMGTLVRLRNEITHYKSKWGQDMQRPKLFETLRKLGLPKSPFSHPGSNFFPHQFLSAGCAGWAVRTAVEFINVMYDRLGIPSPLKPHMRQFEGLNRP